MDKKWVRAVWNGKKSIYLISSDGEVLNPMTNHIISNRFTDGFYRVTLRFTDGRSTTCNVASLMLSSFYNQVKTEDTVLHFKDDDRSNLSLDNIEFITIDEFYSISIKNTLVIKGDVYYLKNGNLKDEYWIVVAYKGRKTQYAVSNCGRLYNYVTNVFISPCYSRDYPSWNIRVYDNPHFSVQCHRLVALLFVPNDKPDTRKFVNHKDDNKKNFHASNLEWTTQSENAIAAVNTGAARSGENHPNTTVTDDEVRQICQMLQDGYKTSEIMNTLHVSRGVIRHIKDRHGHTSISKDYDFSSKSSRLSDKDLEIVYSMTKDNIPNKEIAKRLNCSINTVIRAKRKLNIVRSTVTKSQLDPAVLRLYKDGISKKDISDLLGIKLQDIRDIISAYKSD